MVCCEIRSAYGTVIICGWRWRRREMFFLVKILLAQAWLKSSLPITSNIGRELKGPVKRGRELMRVGESCNSRWRLSASSHQLLSNLNWFKF